MVVHIDDADILRAREWARNIAERERLWKWHRLFIPATIALAAYVVYDLIHGFGT